MIIQWWLLADSWGSQGKSTEVACHSLLQWTMFRHNSPPTPVRLGWPYTAGLVSLSWTRLWSVFGPLADWIKTVFLCWWLAVSVVWASISRPVSAGPSPGTHSVIPLFVNWLMLLFCLCFLPPHPLYICVANSHLSLKDIPCRCQHTLSKHTLILPAGNVPVFCVWHTLSTYFVPWALWVCIGWLHLPCFYGTEQTKGYSFGYYWYVDEFQLFNELHLLNLL